MIRPAMLADRAEMLDILLQQAEKYPLRPDTDKMWRGITEAISTKKHFAWVVEENGGIHGVFIALTSDNLWAQRMNSNIVAWVTNVPGEGIKLLREFAKWVKSRRAIKVAGMTIDCEVDDRVWDLAARVGFERRNGTLVLFN